MQEKNEEETIPFEKESFSSEMVNAKEHKKTTLGKSVGVSDEEKLYTDNIIPCNILNRPSPIN